jgi:hypothetical protein
MLYINQIGNSVAPLIHLSPVVALTLSLPRPIPKVLFPAQTPHPILSHRAGPPTSQKQESIPPQRDRLILFLPWFYYPSGPYYYKGKRALPPHL